MPARRTSSWSLRLAAATLGGLLVIAWLNGAFDGPQNALNNSALPFYGHSSLQPHWDRWSSWQRTARFELQDQQGRDIDETSFVRRPSIVGFFLSGCVNVCPASVETLRMLEALLRRQGRAVVLPHVFLLSVNPEADSPRTLADYAQRLQLPADWTLATGAAAEVERLTRSLMNEPAHAQRAFLLDAQRRVRGIYSTTSVPDMQRLAGDFRRLLAAEPPR